MGLITNGHRNGFSPFRWMNGNVLSIQNGVAIRNGYLPGKLHNWQTHAERQTALPNGNLHPYSWLLPRTGGGMSMRAEGDGTLAANLIPTINGSLDLTGTGGLTAEAALVVSMFCALLGSGTLSANIVGFLNMSVDLEGSGDFNANLSGIANMLVDLQGSGDLEAVIAAYGNMSIDIVVTGTGLSTANIGQAVWTAILNQFNDNPDSAAAKLLAAGSAGDPWSTVLPGSYTGAQAGKLLDQIQTLVDELHKVQGLDNSNPVRDERINSTTSKTSVGSIIINRVGPEDSDVLSTREP